MKFKVLEVGSTNTKVYQYDKTLQNLELITIEFKNNYKKYGVLYQKDQEMLISLIKKIQQDSEEIHVFGTSIFRNLKEAEKAEWINYFEKETGIKFQIVSSIEENDFTILGVLNECDYQKNIAVMIGGGGSTELSIINQGKKIKDIYCDFGAMDVIDQFPSLKEDKATDSFINLIDWTNKKIEKITEKADVLVLAGGDFLKFYQECGFPLEKNSFYESNEQPFMLDKEKMLAYDDEFFYHCSLDEIKQKSKEPKWWTGTRGMRVCARTMFQCIDAKYIIPTKINMIHGIVAKILEDNK